MVPSVWRAVRSTGGYALALLGFFGCIGSPRVPTVAVTNNRANEAVTAVDTAATVVFAWPECSRYVTSPIDAADSRELHVCWPSRLNRLRIVEQGGRLVADIGVGEMAAVRESPGKHLYGAVHWEGGCGRHPEPYECVGALRADLRAGNRYVVTFEWTRTGWRSRSRESTARLDMVPLQDSEQLMQRLLTSRRLVELRPDYVPSNSVQEGTISTLSIGSSIHEREAQDRRAGLFVPSLTD